jgi:DNA invertase Pin-like site-specific DNA recombinase
MAFVKLHPEVQRALELRRQNLITTQQAIDALNGHKVLVRPPAFFAYIRVSSEEQIDGASLDVQRQQAELKFQSMKLLRTELEWGGVFSDQGYSAFKIPLLDRPEGRRLNENLRSGDVVCVYRLDRLFRSLKDFIVTLTVWKDRGVRLISLAEDFDMSTPWGEMVATILVAFAQLESRIKSERTKDGQRMRRMQGRVSNGDRPAIGKMRVKYDGIVYEIPDRTQLCVIPRLVELRESGLSFALVSDQLEAELAQAEGRLPRGRAVYSGPKRLWTKRRCECAYGRRHELLADLAKIEEQEAEEARINAQSGAAGSAGA